MDNHYRKKNKITSSPDEQVIITDNNSNTSNRHLATASSTISPPKSIKSRTTTPSSTGQQSINSASSVSSNMTTTTGTTSKDTQNIDSNVNNNGQSESNNLSFSSTDSGRSSISSSQTSNGEEVGENSFNTTKVTVLTVSDVDTLNSRSDNDDDDDNNNRNSKSNSDSHNNHNDSSPSASADLDIYSDVTLIPKSTITIDFTLKANKKSTKRVNGRKPIKGIKSIRQTITGTKQNDLKMHEDMSTKCGAETSTPGPYSLLVTKADRLHNLEDKYLQKCSLKSADNQLPSQEDSIPIDHSSGPPQFTEDSQQSIISDSSFILSPNSSSSVLPRSVTQNRHITDKTTKEDPSFQPETQIRNPHTMNHKRTELFTKISDSTSIHKGEHYKVESNSSNIKSPNSSDLSISITSQKDINDLSREINSEISSPLNYNKTIEMIKSNSTSDMFDNFTPITSVTVTTSIVVVNANESLKTGSSISVNSNPRSKLNYYSKDTDHVNNHNFTTNRRKFRNSSNNSNNNNNDFSSFNLKSLLNNKYMKNFLMQPFLMPECMNTTAYTTMNNYELAHLRKSFFNNESSKQNFQTATAAAAALLPDPTVFINSSPYYYWLPSSGFNNTTNNTNTTYTTDCMKLYNDKIITNTNSNNNLNYMHGGNRFILQQFNNHISNGTDDFNSCESLNGNMISTSIPKVSNDEFNHTKQDSNTQSVTSNLSKTSSNPISRSMTKLNSLIPDDVVNRSHFENRPSSAKDLILTDIPSKGNKENPSNTPIYKGYTHNNNDIKISKCQSNAEYLITVDHNSDKLGPNKYGPTESNLEMMVVNMANSLGYPISVITSPMQTDIPQIPIDEIMSIDRNGTASSSSSGMTTTAATNTKGVVNNCIPNPDSYLTAPTTFIYFYNNEGQLFALPSNALIFPTAVGRLGAPGTSNETAYNNPSTLVTSQANGSTNHNNNGSSNGNSSTPLRTNGCVSNYELPDQLYSGIDYSAMLKQADTNHCRELISGYSVPMQPSFLSGFHQWLPGQITVDNQMGSQQLQNSSSNPLVIPPNQGIIIHPSCQFSLPAMGIIQPLLSNVFPNQTLSSTSNSEENGGNQNLSKQKNSQSTIPSVMNRSTEQFKLRRFTNDLPSLLGNAKSSRSGAGSGKLSNSNNNHSKYTSRGLMSSFLDDDNAAINSQNSTSRQKKHASKTNLYIRGLPASFTEEELHTLAPDRKLIRSVKLIAGAEGEMYGFIDFVNNEAAKSALVHIKSGNRDLYVNFAYESEKDPQNVYITNIPESWTASNVEDLKQIFQPYGQIATAIVMTKRSNNFCTGAGFVRFIRPEDAQRAIDGIRNAQITLENGKGPLEVKLADRQKPSDDQISTKARSLKRNSEPPESTTPCGIINGNEENIRYSRTRKQSDCLLPNENHLSNRGSISSGRLRSNPGVLGPATDLTSWEMTNRLNNSDSLMLALRAAWASNTLQNQNFLLRNSIGQNNLSSNNENNRGLLPIPNPNVHLTNFMSQQKVQPTNGMLPTHNPVQHSFITGQSAAAAAVAAVTALLPFSRPIDSYSLSQALIHTPVTPTMIGPMLQPTASWTASPLISNIYQSM